jgi:DeoR family transcriptional regulator of aga operon/DeoR family fructose operon transcriptional repressor
MNQIETTGTATKPVSSTTQLFTHERRQQIAHLLEEQQRVTVPELSTLFSVSEVTIRKDLAWLEERNLLVRTHGGAVSVHEQSVEQEFELRERLQHTEKERIAAMAATLVQDGDAIALDSSTTALALARLLKERRELMVVTNGLRNGLELVTAPGVSVLIPGGMLRQESFSLVGTWGKSVLEQVHIKTVFVGARGFTLEEGLTEIHADEVAYKRALLDSARDVVALIDHSKWGYAAFATFCSLERLRLIITDEQAPQEMVEQVRRRGIEVWIA